MGDCYQPRPGSRSCSTSPKRVSIWSIRSITAAVFEAGLITDPELKTAAVMLRIDQILTLFGEVLQEREPGLGW